MIGFISKARLKAAQLANQPTSVHASLFARSEKFGVQSVPFDLLLNESHALEFELGDHTIENGAVITDHVHTKLRSCTIKGYFTNHPLKGDVKADYSAFVSTQLNNPALGGKEPTLKNRALEMLGQIESLAKRKEPVRLVTALKIYPEMLIQRLSYSREPNNGSSITFTMTLREFQLATVREKKYTVNLKTEAGKVAATPGQNGLNSAQEKSVSILATGGDPFNG